MVEQWGQGAGRPPRGPPMEGGKGVRHGVCTTCVRGCAHAYAYARA